jgi:hypothetical protein
MIFVYIISTLHVSGRIGHLHVLTVPYLFIYANILEAMAVGHFSYQPKFMCCNGDRHE